MVQMLLTRGFCLLFVAMSYMFATLNISIIVNIMSFSWGIVSGAFIGPYIVGIFSKRANKLSGMCGIFSGVFAILIPTVIITLKSGFAVAISLTTEMGVFAMAVSIIVSFAVSRFEKPISAEKQKLLFEKEAM